MTSHANWRESMTGRLGVHGVAGWMSRSLHAMRADLDYVDSRSLDVLLLCTDEVDAREPREADVDSHAGGSRVGL